ncbi:hypothetical protein QZH41_006794 [Actinostola sp. cb2023]|nr:hypothetical protein QZH41_006794 [Actinostola sp. cb2023]
MGHCSSYDEMRTVDTSIALEMLAKAEELGTVIPSNIVPGPFVQLAADNNDLNEETLDGKNTTHATTMVVFQRKSFGPFLPQSPIADQRDRRSSLQSSSTIYEIQECSAHGRRPAVSAYVENVSPEWPNYARWMPVYLADMNQLERKYPLVYKEFVGGNHSISRSGQPFSQVSTDMALEQSVNADSKRMGGIIGISQSQAAVERWFLTAHERAAMTTALKEAYGIQNRSEDLAHKRKQHQRASSEMKMISRSLSAVSPLA